MKPIVQEIAEQFQQNILDVFEQLAGQGITALEEGLMEGCKKAVRQLVSAYAEALDEAIQRDKAGRKEAGLVVERKGDQRAVLGRMGEIQYQRTYYQDRQSGGYRYPVDEILRIEKGQRVSEGLGLLLVKAVREMSYEVCRQQIAGGAISRQTVMNKVRQCQPQQEEIKEKRKVAVLHVDADEDHVTLVGGKKSMVPLISVYEGIRQEGERRICENIFHVSEYGLDADSLWEKALDEMDRRYDLEGTTIYLHGDGAKWINTGQSWLPRSIFVLDKYHKNKAIKIMTAGIEKKLRQTLDKQLRAGLLAGNKTYVRDIGESLCREQPQREKKIREGMNYLINQIKGVQICQVDPEANRGGCTEPHVSNVLSRRLSSRPRVWSKETLTRLAPILASQGELERKKPELPKENTLARRAIRQASKILKSKNALGLPKPETIGAAIPTLAIGKKTPLFQAIYAISR